MLMSGLLLSNLSKETTYLLTSQQSVMVVTMLGLDILQHLEFKQMAS